MLCCIVAAGIAVQIALLWRRLRHKPFEDENPYGWQYDLQDDLQYDWQYDLEAHNEQK
jgi:hypothetical protein